MLLLLLSRFSCVWLCATPETSAHQAPPPLGFSRQEHWSGLPLLSPPSHHRETKNMYQLSSVAQLCLTLCDPMNRSTPGLPVHHQLPEFTQLMSIESMIPSSHLILCRPLLLLPLIPPSIRVFSNESHLRMRWPKYWSFSFSISFSKEPQDWSPLEWTGWISLQSKGLSRVFSNTTIQKHQFFSAQLTSQSNSHIHA